jgi:putative glutamine amidotransferase
MDAPIIGITGYADRSARPPNVSVFALARTYVYAVAAAGGAPVILPPYLEPSHLRRTLNGVDGLILSGGGDIYPSFFGEKDQGLLWRVDDERDRTEIALAKWALAEGIPVLAICRGVQVLNVASGGTLIQDIPTQVENPLSHSSVAGRPVPRIAHPVEVESNTRLATLIGAGTVGVNSAHHQAAKSIGSDLVATARAPDGVIEGLEAPDHRFCIGVQWHPEAMVEETPVMLELFQGLVEAAQA